MATFVILGILVLSAVLAPRYGVDTRRAELMRRR